MKTRPLPPIDLARITVHPPITQRAELEVFKLSWAPYSYDPFRASLHDIMNVQSGFLPSSARTPWEKIEAEIAKLASKRGDDAVNANVKVGAAVYNLACEREVSGRRETFRAFPIGLATTLSFWSSAVLAFEGRPTVIFIDPRRTKGLTAEGRRFAFSVMHERIRALDDAFAEVDLAILQFDAPKVGPRTARLHHVDEVRLFGFEELDAMVRTTYRIWNEVLVERQEAERKSAKPTAGSVPLLTWRRAG